AGGDLNLMADDGVSYFDGAKITAASSVTMTQVNTGGKVNITLGDDFQSVRLRNGLKQAGDVLPSNLSLFVGSNVDTVLVNASVAQNETVAVGDGLLSATTALPAPSVWVCGSVGDDLALTIG